MPQAHDVIQVTPPDNGRPFWFRNLNLTSGLRGFYASATVGDRPIWQQSIFDNIRCTGAHAEGFFFDKLWAIGVMFTRIRAENCGGDGIRFSGRTQLNGATIINARSSDNDGAGYRFDRTGGQANTPAVGLHGCIAEWNFGPGMHFLGYNASLYDPYFEGNDNNQDGDGPDLLLSSNLSGTIPSQITAIGAYFGPMRHPVRIGVGIGGTQHLTLINPKFAAGSIDASKLTLEGSGINLTKTPIKPGVDGMPAISFGAGLNLSGSRSGTTTPALIGIPAKSTKGAVLQVLAANREADGGQVAMYLVRRKMNGTIAPTLVGGTDILTFGVDAAGMITVAAKAGQVTYSISGY